MICASCIYERRNVPKIEVASTNMQLPLLKLHQLILKAWVRETGIPCILHTSRTEISTGKLTGAKGGNNKLDISTDFK